MCNHFYTYNHFFNYMLQWKLIFDQVGYVINQYVPELYGFELFKDTHILWIYDDSLESLDGFEKYVNLTSIRLHRFNDSLIPISKLPIKKLHMNDFTQSLEPLTGNSTLEELLL